MSKSMEPFSKEQNRRSCLSIVVPVFWLVLMCVGITPSSAQVLTPGQVQQARQQLSAMSPDEIDQKIKAFGITRQEAEKRAKENGIDLSSYLRGLSAGMSGQDMTVVKPLVVSGPSASAAPSDTVKVSVSEAPARKDPPSSNGIPYFGYDVFQSMPSAFEPAAAGPVDADYLIGPDDVLRLTIWGQVEQQSELVVDKEGRVVIPSIGPVVLTGMTLDDANRNLTKLLSRSIQGLTSSPRTVWLDLTLAKVRPKKVFIMGEVAKPGGYTVGSYATIFNTLFAVGGPTVNGSLREIRLIRDNKVVAKVDLYQYLAGAEKTNDIRVQNNDIIFVPVRKNTITVTGEVRHPAIFELLPGENLRRLIDLSGGVLPSAYLERVQIDRIIPMKDRKRQEFEREFRDVNLRDVISRNVDVPLVDGDNIIFLPIQPDRKNFVTIGGAVFKPGRFQWVPKLRLLDLIMMADSLRPEAYTIRGELTRTEKNDQTRLSLPFELAAVLKNDPAANIELQPKDEVIIHDLGLVQEANQIVDIYGSVKLPGRYRLTRNMVLTDVLLLAGGYSEDAWVYSAEIARVERKDNRDTIITIMFNKLQDLRSLTDIQRFNDYTNFRKDDLLLRHRDKIFIRPDPLFKVQKLVAISGEVAFPGQYALLTQNECLTDIIQRSGGSTRASYLQGGTLVRGGQRVNVDFALAMANPHSGSDIVLHEGDVIEIPKKPNMVKVNGEVYNPSIFGFIEGEKLWDYIDRAGGLKDSADYIVLYQPSGNAERFRKGIFGGNSVVLDGSTIVVSKIPPPPPDKKELDLGNLIRDLFAIAASALTVLVLARQL